MQRVLFILGLLMMPACDSSAPDEGQFFDPEALDENSVVVGDDFDAVECAGEGDIALRGQVLAPAGRLAVFPDWLVPSAHAGPLEGELVVSDVQVELYDREKPEDVWGSTRTDPVGRYCLRLPKGQSPSTTTMLRATAGSTTLRRIVTHRDATTISVSSEALVRIIQDEPDMTIARAINLETVADTAVDLMNPTNLADSNVEAAVEEVEKLILADVRVKAQLSD